MAWKLEIATVDKTSSIDLASGVEISLRGSERSTARFTTSHGYKPDLRAEVVIYDTDGVTALFGGIVFSRDSRGIAQWMKTDCDCVDWTWYLDNVTMPGSSITGTYTLLQVLQWIQTNLLATRGFTLDPAQVTGPSWDVTGYTWERKALSSFLRDNVGPATQGYVFYITTAKVWGMKLANLAVADAPFTITDGSGTSQELQWKETSADYANKIILPYGDGLAPAEVTAGTGLIERILPTATGITDAATAQAEADGWLVMLNQSPRTFTIDTITGGLRPAQVIDIVSTIRDSTAKGLITDVTISLETDTFWRYRADVIAGVYQGSALDAWRGMGGSGGGMGGIIVTAPPVGQALTKADDTNVTLTLGGSPTIALVTAASITAGWTGQLGLTRGGTAASLTAAHGAIAYSTASALGLSAVGSSGQILRSAGASAPTWSTATFPATATTVGAYLRADGTNWITSTLMLPNAATAGRLVTVISTNSYGDLAAGSLGQILRSTGAGTVPEWSTATYPATATTTGAYLRADGTNWIMSTLVLPNAATANQVVYASATNTYGGSANLTFDGTHLSLAAGRLTFSGNTATGATGSAYKTAVNGLSLWAATGTTNDFVLADAAGGTFILTVPTGTQNLNAAGWIGHSSYVSQTTNWRITSDGGADFRYIYADEMHVKSFIADLEQALAGGQIITKSVAMVAQAFTVPAAAGTATLWVRDLPSANNMAVFVSGDTVLLRSFSRANGGLIVGNAIGVVTAYADGTGANEGQQSWTFTRNSGANAGTLAASIVVPVDSIALDFGTSGNGYHEITAIDGTLTAVTVTRTGSIALAQTTTPHGFQTSDTVVISGANQAEYNGAFTITVISGTTFEYTVTGTPATPATGTILINGANGTNAPYAQIVTWTTSPIPVNLTVRTRLGNLRGITAVNNEYGFIAGTYAATNGQYLRASNQAFELHGIDLSLWDGATNVFAVRRNSGDPYLSLGSPAPTAYGANAGIFFIADTGVAKASFYADANNYLQYNGSVLTWKAANSALDASGNLTATSATLSGAITATSGTITGAFTIGTSGTFASGATAYGTGTGIWAAYNAGTPQFRVGIVSGNRLAWDGTDLTVVSANVTIDTNGVVIEPHTGTFAYQSTRSYRWTTATGNNGISGFDSSVNGRGMLMEAKWTGTGDRLNRIWISADNAPSSGGTADFADMEAFADGVAPAVTLRASHGGNVSLMEITATRVAVGKASGGGSFLFLVNSSTPVQMANYGAGTATFDASGNITSSSDLRLKTDVEPYPAGLREVLALKPIVFRWTEHSGLDRVHRYVGFGAQDVQMILQYATGLDSRGYLTLNDRAITAALVGAVRELFQEVTTLRAEVKVLREEPK